MKHLLFLFLTVAFVRAQAYQPPTLSWIDPVAKVGVNMVQIVQLGSRGSGTPSILLHYSGSNQFTRTAFSSTGSTTVAVNVPAPLAGSYQLVAVELSDSGGNTIYLRDGSIRRALYGGANLPTSHNVDLSRGDFATGGSTPESFETGRAANLSTRGMVGSGDDVLVVGISVASGARSFLLRAIGPTLGEFSVAGALGDPRIEVRNSAGVVIGSNDNWSSEVAAVAQTVGAFPLPVGSLDAAMKITLPQGGYTMVVRGADGSAGIALVEAYELR